MRILIILLATCSSLYAQVTIKGSDDKTYTPKSIDSFTKTEKSLFVSFKDENGKQHKLDCLDLVEINFGNTTPRIKIEPNYFQVVLTNHDTFHGLIKGLQQGTDCELVEIWSTNFGMLKIKLPHILALRSVQNKSLWQETIPEQRLTHILYYKFKKDATDIRRPVLIKTLTDKEIIYKVKQVEPPIKIDDLVDLFAMENGLFPVPKDPKGLFATIALVDGSRLKAEILNYNGKVMKVRLAYTSEVDLKSESIAGIYFKNSRVVFLSDINPVKVSEQHVFISSSKETDTYFPYQRDKAVVLGGPIIMNNKVYPKGLGVHARTELTYKIDVAFTKFMATIGLDDTIKSKPKAGLASVEFIVMLDNDVIFKSKNITVQEAPLDISVDLKPKHKRPEMELKIIVDFGENGEVLDRANWGMARIVR